jgi:hypothetical protein
MRGICLVSLTSAYENLSPGRRQSVNVAKPPPGLGLPLKVGISPA